MIIPSRQVDPTGDKTARVRWTGTAARDVWIFCGGSRVFGPVYFADAAKSAVVSIGGGGSLEVHEVAPGETCGPVDPPIARPLTLWWPDVDGAIQYRVTIDGAERMTVPAASGVGWYSVTIPDVRNDGGTWRLVGVDALVLGGWAVVTSPYYIRATGSPAAVSDVQYSGSDLSMTIEVT